QFMSDIDREISDMKLDLNSRSRIIAESFSKTLTV
ncbi:actin-related protein 2/3 complex subunit 4, partial [Kipferlia bialata]